jgi:hypothetical protein
VKLTGQRPGSRTLFVDSFTQEVLLEVITDEKGTTLVGFALYDSKGCEVARSQCPHAQSPGLLRSRC